MNPRWKHMHWLAMAALAPLTASAIPFNQSDFFYVRLEGGSAKYRTGKITSHLPNHTPVSKPEKTFDTTKTASLGAVGIQLANYPAQFELAFSYTGPAIFDWSHFPGGQHETIKLKMHTGAYLVNAYYNLYAKKALKPYVMAGMGYGQHVTRFSHQDPPSACHLAVCPQYTQSNKTDNFVYQVGAGIDYDLSPQLSLRAGMKYSNFGRAEVEYKSKAKTGANLPLMKISGINAMTMQAGIAYSFT